VETRLRGRHRPGTLVYLRGLGTNDYPDVDLLVSVRRWGDDGRVPTVAYHPMIALADAVACGEVGKVDLAAIRLPLTFPAGSSA